MTKSQSSDDDSEQEFIPQHASKRSPVQKESARKTTAAGQVNLSDLGAINNIIMGNFEIMSKHFHHERAEKPIAQPEISPVESVKKSPDSSPADQLLILNSLAGILRGFPGAHAAYNEQKDARTFVMTIHCFYGFFKEIRYGIRTSHKSKETLFSVSDIKIYYIMTIGGSQISVGCFRTS